MCFAYIYGFMYLQRPEVGIKLLELGSQMGLSATWMLGTEPWPWSSGRATALHF